MSKIRVYVREGELYSNPVKYTLSVIQPFLEDQILFVNQEAEADLIWDHQNISGIPISLDFYQKIILHKIYHHALFLDASLVIKTEDQKPDYIASIFYFCNSLQEYVPNQDHYDTFGRFKYSKTYQSNYSCIDRNLVDEHIVQFCRTYLKTERRFKTRLFLSHDIDTVYGSFKEDGFWALKHGRIDVLLKLLFHQISRKPLWLNIDKIKKIHDEYSLKSTFFWLVNSTVCNGVKNADYAIDDVRSFILKTPHHGLHKSSAPETHTEEAARFNIATTVNRNHFLRFTLPEHWINIENSSIDIDCSLGFAERYGFRNSFGYPFHPYNFENGKPFRFLEVPLHLMDGTFRNYMKIPTHKTAETVIDFIEKHKTNCVLSVLWHNTFFSEYKYAGYLDEYLKILNYLCEQKYESLTPDDLSSF
jgi:hypothetical protein